MFWSKIFTHAHFKQPNTFINCTQYKWLGLNEHGCQVNLSYHRNAQTPDIRSNVKTLTARWWMNSLRLQIKTYKNNKYKIAVGIA